MLHRPRGVRRWPWRRRVSDARRPAIHPLAPALSAPGRGNDGDEGAAPMATKAPLPWREPKARQRPPPPPTNLCARRLCTAQSITAAAPPSGLRRIGSGDCGVRRYAHQHSAPAQPRRIPGSPRPRQMAPWWPMVVSRSAEVQGAEARVARKNSASGRAARRRDLDGGDDFGGSL